MLADMLGKVGYALDTPGALTRGGVANLADLLRGQNRHRGFRASGRQMLDSLGVGGGYKAGLAADFLVDPLAWAGAGAAFQGAKHLDKAAKAMGVGGALKSQPGLAYSMGAPTAGFGVMAMNEEQDPKLNLLSAALMMSPLAVGMAKGVKGMAKGARAGAAADVPGGFRSRLHESLLEAPDEFVTTPTTYKTTEAKSIMLPTGPKHIPAKEIVKQKGQTAHEKLMGYLRERTAQAEVDYVLGPKLSPTAERITKPELMEMFKTGQISITPKRAGGRPTKGVPRYERKKGYGWRNKQMGIGITDEEMHLHGLMYAIPDWDTRRPRDHMHMFASEIWNDNSLRTQFDDLGEIFGGHPLPSDRLTPTLTDRAVFVRQKFGTLARFNEFLGQAGEGTKSTRWRRKTRMYEYGVKDPEGSVALESKYLFSSNYGTKAEARQLAEEWADRANLQSTDVKPWTPVVRPAMVPGKPELGRLTKEFESDAWWIKGGRDRMETPIVLQNVRPESFLDDAHYGENVVGWINSDRRTMPDGLNAKYLQEYQSNWDRAGTAHGYRSREIPAEAKLWEKREKFRDALEHPNRYGDMLRQPDNPWFQMDDAPFIQKELSKLDEQLKGTEDWLDKLKRTIHGSSRSQVLESVPLSDPSTLRARDIEFLLSNKRKLDGMMDQIDSLRSRVDNTPSIIRDATGNAIANPKWDAELIPQLSRMEGGLIAAVTDTLDPFTRLVPDMPFKNENNLKLLFRQTIAEAIRDGDEYVLLANSQQVGTVSSLASAKRKMLYDQLGPKVMNGLLKEYGVSLAPMPLPGFGTNATALGFRIPQAMKERFNTRGFRLLSALPWAALGAGAGGTALTHALTPEQA